MRKLNLNSVTAKTGGDFSDLPPGGYICRIQRVEDVPDKEYLRVELDVAAGEYKDYYRDLYDRAGFWGCTMFWSYKEANLPYFKGNITSVEDSNTGYRFSDQSEQDLVGKLVGAVFGEEEYKSGSGDIKCNTRPRFLCSAQRIMDKDYKVPNRKAYNPARDNRARAPQPANQFANQFRDLNEDVGPLPWDDDPLPL